MKTLAELVIAIAVLTVPVTGWAQTLTEAQARAAIAPWYQLFNQPVQGDMKTLQEQILTAGLRVVLGLSARRLLGS